MVAMYWRRLGLLTLLCIFSFISTGQEYFKFRNQAAEIRPGATKEGFNYATLNSLKPLSSQFSICSSLLVEFMKEFFSFFVVMNEDGSLPWITFYIYVDSQGTQPLFYLTPAVVNWTTGVGKSGLKRASAWMPRPALQLWLSMGKFC